MLPGHLAAEVCGQTATSPDYPPADGEPDAMSEPAVPRRSRSGSDTRQRSERRTYRFTQDELAKLEADARAAGMTAPSYVRHLLTGGKAPRAVRRPPVELETLRVLLGRIGKVGGNINQMAHKANTLNLLPPLEVLREIQRDMRAMRDAMLESLGYEIAE